MNEKENVTLEELQKLSETSDKMARNIRMLSRGFKKFANSGLREETITLLLHDASNVGKTDIRAVLLALKNLEQIYTIKEEIREKKED